MYCMNNKCYRPPGVHSSLPHQDRRRPHHPDPRRIHRLHQQPDCQQHHKRTAHGNHIFFTGNRIQTCPSAEPPSTRPLGSSSSSPTPPSRTSPSRPASTSSTPSWPSLRWGYYSGIYIHSGLSNDKTLLTSESPPLQDSDCDGDLECLGGTDDGGNCGLGSVVSISGACSTQYFLYVTGFDSEGGAFTLESLCA